MTTSLLSDVASTEAVSFRLYRELWPTVVVATFTVDGEPMSKARARVVNGHAFTPAATKRAEDLVAWRFREAASGHQIDATKNYGVFAVFFAGTRQRRDVDNMLKLILDGLNGVAWVDDNSVLEVSGRKSVCSKTDARTEICIYELPPPQHLNSFNCSVCGVSVKSYPSLLEGRKTFFCSDHCKKSTGEAQRVKICPGCGVSFKKAKATYCTTACLHQHKTVDVPCTQCATMFNRPQSWLTNGRPFCSPECRVAYHREHRAISARGTCSTCGGSTSKKCYTRCHACKIEAERLERAVR